ncbi:MAG: hypothetical protein RLZZ15_2950 [Verrucomicrobiota bacterium]|jgi:tetratricopeptide (TPR) repeat protein
MAAPIRIASLLVFRLLAPLGVGGLVFTLACAGTARAHGSFHERIAQLTAAIERSPCDARAHFELAELFARHGDWALALGAADSADEFQPAAFPTDLIRGEAHLALARPAAARAALDRFLKTKPGHARALVLRARATSVLDGPEAALADFRAALKSPSPPDPDHVREAADALVACCRRDEAIEALARAIALLGPDPALLRHALDLEIAAGRTDSALTRIAALEASAPRREPWMARRAQVLTAAQRITEARAAWSDLLRHLDALPNLERGQPALRALATEARVALNPSP